MLVRLLLAATLGASATLAAATAQEARTVILREQPATDDAIVTLGDLFDGVDSDVALARAPAPGQTLSLDPGFVSSQAAQAGLRWVNATGLQRVAVTRRSRPVSGQELADLIGSTLYLDTGRAHDVVLANRALTLHAPIDTTGAPELVSLETDPRSGLFRAEIAPYPGGVPVTVTGRAETVLDVPVLTQAIASGEVISARDIEWIRLRADRVRADTILREDMLVGQAARRSLRPGEALRAYDLQVPVVIERGETVQLAYQVGGLTLTARARALTDLGVGEIGRFVNLQSNRTIEARVEGPGRALIDGPAAAS